MILVLSFIQNKIAIIIIMIAFIRVPKMDITSILVYIAVA